MTNQVSLPLFLSYVGYSTSLTQKFRQLGVTLVVVFKYVARETANNNNCGHL
jgi:hypothetical protein